MLWFLLLCVHLLTFSSSGFVFGALCPSNQSSLLLKLKHGFLYDSRLGSWISRSDCCLWEGVTCDNTTGLITGLDLSTSPSDFDFESIRVKIDPSLFKLRSLRILNLGGNDFKSSSTLYGLEQLTNLTHLNLSYCWFHGQIPLQISHLTRLVSLDLSYAQLASLDPSYGGDLEIVDLKTFLHNLTALQQLYLNGIKMSMDTSDWSQTISSALPHLRELSLESCELSGPIQASLLQLPFLTKLNLGYNDLSLLTADSFSTPSSMRLRYLDLSRCQLELGGNNRLLKKIFQLPNLHTLDLSYNNLPTPSFPSIPPNNNVSLRFLGLRRCLNGTFPKSIFNLKFLNHLDLYDSFVMGGIPENMGDLKFLKHLDLSYNFLTGGMPEKLGDLKFLNYMDLSSNYLTGGIPEKLGDLKLLNYLHLSYNYLTGGIPEKLGDLKLLNYMDLSSNNLTGGIPEKLGDLKLLNYMYLSSNNLTGGIPEKLGDLKLLSYMDLSSNNLNGGIPEKLGDLKLLYYMDLSSNKLSGGIPEKLGDLKWLSCMDLSSNNLSGGIPGRLGDLKFLNRLYLSSNNFSGTVYMGMFRSLMNLEILDLSDNSFTVDFNNDSIGNNPPLFSGLRTLLLRSCNLSESWWFFLSNQTGLFQLDLSNNRIHGAIPNWIWQFGILRHLNLSHNRLTSIEKPVNLSSCYLLTLDLHDNMLEGSLPIPAYAFFLDYSINRFASMIPADIGRYLPRAGVSYVKGRYFLSLSDNKFVGEIPLTICDISSSLKVLDMSNNRLTGLIPWCLTNTTDMIILSLRENDLHGNIPDGFVETSSLRTLDLNSNQFSGPIPKSLINCTLLQVLDLGNNHLNDTFPSWLENLPHLHVLALGSNQFHGMIKPNQIRGGFRRLQIIDLSTNKFTGNLPVEYFRSWKFIMEGGQGEPEDPTVLAFEESRISYSVILPAKVNVYYQDVISLRIKRLEQMYTKILTIFTFVDLSNNKFDGRIPAELGNLKFLVALNLSLNNLYGQIPSSLGNLSWVESMDLSRNSLSGEIPPQLANLNFLAVLDLSQNRLTGRIPEGAQFSTFTNASFEGNLGLCGPPLSLKCTRPSPPMEPTKGEATLHHEVDKLDFVIPGILGFFCGIALVIWPLLFSNKWRRWYYGCVDKVLMWVSYYLCCM